MDKTSSTIITADFNSLSHYDSEDANKDNFFNEVEIALGLHGFQHCVPVNSTQPTYVETVGMSSPDHLWSKGIEGEVE